MDDIVRSRLEALETRAFAMEAVFAEIMRAAFLSLPDGNARLQDAIALAKETIRTPSGQKAENFTFAIESRFRDLEKRPTST